MSDLFPAGRPRPQPADFMEIAISMLEADPHALDEAKSMIPTTEALIDAFPELDAVDLRDLDVEGPGGSVPARLYRVPDRAVTDAFVWVHGGAFIFGDLDILESHWVALSIASRGVPVVALDDRKALNGVTFPAPVTSCRHRSLAPTACSTMNFRRSATNWSRR